MKLTALPAGLVAAASLTLLAGPASAAQAPVHVTLTKHGPVLRGPTTWRSGLARIAAASRLPDQEVTLLHFRRGYTYADFLADARRSHGHGAAARAAVARVLAHTIFDGGVDIFTGQSASFTVRVRPGTYYLGEMNDPPQLTAIHVTRARRRASLPPAATITATDHRFRVRGPLPAHGTVTFANTSRTAHRLNLVPVQPGTTRAMLLDYVRQYGDDPQAPPPPFALDGPQVGTAELSPGQRMQFRYRLPAGTYAAIDFDQDMRTGRPEALEGLARIITLR